MKKSLIALAFAAAASSAFAQVGVDSNSGATAGAQVGDIGITAIMQMPSANPFQINEQRYSGGYTVSGMPVASVASSFASPAVWRCSRAGGGAAAQGEKFGLSFAWGGDDSPICGVEFRIAISSRLVELRVASEKETNALQKAALYDAYVVGHALACTDDALADSFEGTRTMQCAAPNKDARKARWDREAAAAQARRTAMAQPGTVSASALQSRDLNLLP